MNKSSLIPLLFASSFSVSVFAEEAVDVTPDVEVSPWKASVEFGYLQQSGNNESTALNAKFDATYEIEKWRNNGKFEAVTKSDKEQTTAERYFTSLKSDYKFNEIQYMFIIANYEKDRFSGFEYEKSISTGYGHRLVNTPEVVLDLEIGPGYRASQIDENALENPGKKESGAMLRSSVNLDWHINKSALFEQDLLAESGSDNTLFKSVTSVKSQLMSQLAMKVSYTVKHLSEVPEGSENTDTEMAVTLVYNFF